MANCITHRIWFYFFVLTAGLTACKNDKKSTGDGGIDSGMEDAGSIDRIVCEPEISVETKGGETSIKEAEILFTVESCDGAEAFLRREDELFDRALDLGDGHYRRFVSLSKGSNEFTIVVPTADGDVEGPEITFDYVPKAPEAGETSGFVTGTVVCETDGEPIEGATLFLRGVEGELTADAAGAFHFPTPDAGRFVLTVEADGYTLAQRRVEVTVGSIFQAGDIRLMPLDETVAEITPEAGGSLKNSDGSIELSIPAGAVRRERQISGVSFPSGETLPGALPDSSRWTQAFDLHPDGVLLNKPADIKLKNVNGFAPGTKVPIGYYNRNTAAWEPDSMGEVSEDGEWIVGTVSHFSSYDCNHPVEEEGRPGFGRSNKNRCKKGRKGSSLIDDDGGQLMLFAPVGVQVSDDETEVFSLVYDSARARPYAPIIAPFTVENNDDVRRLEAAVDLNGVRKNLFLDAPDGEDGYWLAAVFDENDDFETPLTTGIYPARIQLAALSEASYMSADIFGGPGLSDLDVETRELVPFTTEQTVPVTVVDDSESPLGAGWRFEPEERIVPSVDGSSVLWIRSGDEAVIPFGEFMEDEVSFNAFTMYNNIRDFYLLEDDALLLVGAKQIRRAPRIEDAAEAEIVLEPEEGVLGSTMGPEGLIFLDSNYALNWMSDDGEITRTANVEDLLTAYRDENPDGGADEALPISSTGAMAADESGIVYVALNGYGFAGVNPSTDPATLSLYPMLALPGEERIKVRDMVYEASTHSLYLQVPSSEVIQKYDLYARNESTFLQVAGGGLKGSAAISLAPNGDLYYVVDDALGTVGPGRTVVPLSSGQFGIAERFGVFAEAIRFDSNGTPVALCNEYTSVPNYPSYHLVRMNPETGHNPDTGDTVVRTDDGFRIEEDFNGQQWHGYREFDAAGRLVKRVTRDGEETYTYGDDGLESFESVSGAALYFTYDAGGRLSGIESGDGAATKITVDTNGDLTAIEDADGTVMEFTYEDHRMVGRESPSGETVTYTWDDSGGIASAEVAADRTRNFESLLFSAEASGISDRAARPALLSEGAYEAKHWYGNDGLLNAVEYGGVRWEVSTGFSNYDPTLPLWTTVTLTGRDDEKLEALLVGDALRSIMYNDETLLYIGRRLLNENGESIADGVIEDIADSTEGLSCGFTYDEADRVTVVSCTDYYLEYGYTDGDDLPDEVTDYDGNVTAFGYDSNGNVETITYPGGGVERYERNASGFVTAFEDINGGRREIERSALGAPLSITDALGRTTIVSQTQALTCDGCAGNRVDLPSGITDAAGNQWTMAVRADSNITSLTDPAGNVRTYGYDARGRLVRSAGQDDDGCDIEYDVRGNVVEEHIGDETVTHSYDAQDRVVRSDDGRTVITRTYDDDTHEIVETVTDTETGVTAEVGWVLPPYRPQRESFYSSLGHRYTAYDASRWYPLGWTSDGSFLGNTEVYRSYSGEVSERTMYNEDEYAAVQISYSFDELQRPYYADYAMGIDYNRSASCDYTYAGSSDLLTGIACTEGSGLPENTAYSYDALGRLTEFSSNTAGRSVQAEYTYNDAGLMETHTDLGTLAYDDALRLVSTDLATYTYEPRGTRATRTDADTGEVMRYSFNGSEQLTSVEIYETAAADTPSATVQLTYDPHGRLFRIDDDGEITYLIWLDDQLIAELDENGDAIRRYVPGDLPDTVSIVEQDGESFYAVHDETGTVHQLVDETGAVVAGYEYDPWGRLLYSEGEPADQPRRFQGAYFIDSIGLYYLRARFYDPEVGQFVSEDPTIVLDTTMGRYRFADFNPVSNIDPYGCNEWRKGAGVAADHAKKIGKTLLKQNKYGKKAVKAYDFYKKVKQFKKFMTSDKKANYKNGLEVFIDLIPGFSDSAVGKKIKENMLGFGQKINKQVKPPRRHRCREASKIDRMFLDHNAAMRKQQ